MTEDRVLNFERGRGIEQMIVGLKDALTRFKGISTLNTLKNFRELDNEGDRLLGALHGGAGSWRAPPLTSRLSGSSRITGLRGRPTVISFSCRISVSLNSSSAGSSRLKGRNGPSAFSKGRCSRC
ncbi:MAG: hypothetical protein MZV64_11525 [Ignavibacteriales bacterium]|nr:hypothetical protein [Ignavibacteriales bacterium]MCK7518299.1 hypothetical protein [Ignavibacteriales bacterium]